MKEARRVESRGRKVGVGPSAGGEDPDIAGIVPGPQASPWGDEDVVEEADDAEDAEP